MELELRRRLIEAFDRGDIERAQKLRLIIEEREGLNRPVAPEPEEEDAGIFENLASGFVAGAVDIPELAALGAAALLEEDDELAAREKIQRTAEALTPDSGDPDDFSYKLGQAFGSVAGVAGTAYLGAKGAALAGLGSIATGVGTGIAGLTSIGAAAGEASERARAAGATEEERSAATLRGAPIGVLEILPLGRFVKSIDVPVLGDLINKLGPQTVETMGQRIHSAALSGGFEAAQEATAGVLQNLNEQQYNALAETFGGVGEEATLGGIVGATLDLFLPGGSRARMTERGVDDADTAEKVVNELDANVAPEERALQEDLFPEELAEAERQAEAAQVGPQQDTTPQEEDTAPAEEQMDMFPEQKKAAEEVARFDDDAEVDAALAEAAAREDKRPRRKPPAKKAPQQEQAQQEQAQQELELEQQELELEQPQQIKERKPKGRGQQEPLPGQTPPAPKKQAPQPKKLTETKLAEVPAAAKAALDKAGVAVPQPKARTPKTEQPVVTDEKQAEPKLAEPKLAESVPVTTTPPPVATTDTRPTPKGKVSTIDPETGKLIVDTPIKLTDTDRAAFAPVSDVNKYVNEKGKDKDFRTQGKRESDESYAVEKAKFDNNRTVAKYFNAYANPESALRAAVFEVADPKQTAVRVEKGDVDPIEVKRRGTGGKSAKAVVEWAKINLSAETNAIMDALGKADETQVKAAEKNIEERQSDEGQAKQKAARATEDAAKKSKAARERVARRKRREAVAQRKKEQQQKKDVEDTKKAEKAVKKQPTAEQKEAEKKARATEKEVKRQVAEEKRRLEAAGVVFDPVSIEGIIANRTQQKSKEQERKEIADLTEEFIKRGGKIRSFSKKVRDNIRALETPLPENTLKAFAKGDTQRGLEALLLDGDLPPLLQSLTEAVFYNLGNTRVAVVTDADMRKTLRDGPDDPVTLGAYLTYEDLVLLNVNEGTTVETLVHELVHAATVYEIQMRESDGKVFGTTANVKRLNKLYEMFKSRMERMGVTPDDMYGITNLNEFVAEAFSNVDFRGFLSSMQVDGTLDARGREAVEKAKGKRILSFYDSFVETITNMIRRFMGKETSPTLRDEVDMLIYEILRPADQGMSMFPDLRELNGTHAGSRKVMQSIRNIIYDTQTEHGTDKKFTDGILEVLGKLVPASKAKALNLFNSQAVGDVARKLGFGNLGLDLHDAFNSRRGDMDKADQGMRDFVKRFSEWRDSKETNQPLLDKLIYDPEIGATITQVDPELSKTEAKRKYNDEDFATWEKQNEIWNSAEFGAEGRKMYTELRNVYKDQFLKLKQAIFSRLDETVKDGDMSAQAANSFKQLLMTNIFNNATLDVYFPLTRDGDYVVSYALKDPANPEQAYVVQRFTTKAEAKRAVASLKKDDSVDSASIESKLDIGKASMYKNAPSDSFAGQTLKLLQDGGADADLQDAFMRMYVDHLPETSFAKSLRRRKGVLGYDGNSYTALRTKGFDLARQVVQITHSSKINKVVGKISEVERPADVDERTFEATKNHMIDLGKFAVNGANNKGMEKFYKTANQLAFVYTIGFNASSAIVNLSQIPLVVMPYLSARHGSPATFKAVANAAQIVGSSSDKIGGVSIDELFTVDDNGNYKVKESLSEKRKKFIRDMRLDVLVQEAANKGQLTKSFLPDALSVHEQGRKARGGLASRTLDGLSSLGANFGFAQAERLNRQTAMVATYDLTLKQLRNMKRSGKKYYAATKAEFVSLKDMSDADLTTLAAKEALYQTQETNGGAVLETSPKWAQQGIGRVAFMYKTYGLQMYYTMIKSAKLLIDNIGGKTPESKELRRLARRQLAGVYLSSALLAGIQGVPLYGLVRALVDTFLLDDDEEDADTIVRKYIGEGAFKGPLVNALGADFATRIKLTDLVIQTNRYNNDPSTEELIGFHLGGPALSVGNRFIRGIGDLREGNIERGIESLLPAALANVYKSTFGRYARDEGIYTRRGDPVYDDMSLTELGFQALGFAPAGYTFAQETASQEKRLEAGILGRRQDLLKKLNVARRVGDVETYRDTLKEIREFNKDHRERGRRVQITRETLARSAGQFSRRSSETYNGVAVSKSLQASMKQSREDYSQGFSKFFDDE